MAEDLGAQREQQRLPGIPCAAKRGTRAEQQAKRQRGEAIALALELQRPLDPWLGRAVTLLADRLALGAIERGL